MELSPGNGSLNDRRLRVLVHGPARGAWNMAVDETLMESARAGRAALRLYRWEPGCLSFGRNQVARGRYDGRAIAARGLDVVRRPTGGRSVLHHREITYSVTAPEHAWGGLRETYLRINQALAAGLRSLGAKSCVVHGRPAGSVPRPTVRACFRDPLPGEVVSDGRKVIGSAQWRDRGSLLQHGSLLLHNEQGVVEELRVGGGGDPAPVPAAGLDELLDPLPAPAQIGSALLQAFEEAFGLEPVEEDLSASERATAARRRARYEDPSWTWRR